MFTGVPEARTQKGFLTRGNQAGESSRTEYLVEIGTRAGMQVDGPMLAIGRQTASPQSRYPLNNRVVNWRLRQPTGPFFNSDSCELR